MQRDEFDLFPVFIRYYGEIFGYENIHVFDNGSSETMKPLLDTASDLGVHIDYTYNKSEHFSDKGNIMSRIINNTQDKYDIFLPLDCDEFITLDSGNLTSNRVDFMDYFKSLKIGTYESKHRFKNHLTDYTQFYIANNNRKLFFKNTTVSNLDIGFHNCSNLEPINESSLCYLELHNKPYNLFKEHALNKLEHRVSENGYGTYVGPGHHLIKYLLEGGKELYYQDILSQRYIKIRTLIDKFTELGINKDIFNLEDTLCYINNFKPKII